MQTTNYRWVALTVFTLSAGISQMLWLNFAPLLSLIQERYAVDELTASLLILVFPAVYVLLSLHSGALIDRRGYRYTVGLGSVIMAVFSCVRIYDASFAALLIGQTGIAVAQPYIVNGISKLVADWFEEEHHGLATGIGTIGMFLGMAMALALTPVLVTEIELQRTMIVFALLSILSAAAFLLLARENSARDEQTVASGAAVLAPLFQNGNLILLFVLSLLALGFFNGLTTWLEPILAVHAHLDAEQAGLAGGMLIVGGIVGSAVLPALSDVFRRRKPFLLLSATASIFLTLPLCTTTNFSWLLVYAALMGFFFLPGYALLFAMTEEHAGAAHAGSAAGMLMLAGNGGGVLVVLLMEAVRGGDGTWTNAIYFMMALMSAAVLLALRLGESLGRERAHGD